MRSGKTPPSKARSAPQSDGAKSNASPPPPPPIQRGELLAELYGYRGRAIPSSRIAALSQAIYSIDADFGKPPVMLNQRRTYIDDWLASNGGAAGLHEAAELSAYVDASARRSELDRTSSKEKTGVFSGMSAVHPLT